jgi:glutamate N-acetyltransferase/amino-acid N-acetyltransferase
VPLPLTSIVAGIGPATQTLSPECDRFARAIMTTDTKVKVAASSAGDATVVGVAKGAAMLAPNMATMLAFLVTDAAVPEPGLQPILNAAVGVSFDRICVDACESTNDSVFLLAGGEIACSTADLTAAVTEVCRDLAEQMVRDAEGTTKVVRVQVSGAIDDARAARAGRAVAASALWKAAVFGADPNWGRVVAALGTDRELEVDQVSVAIGPELMFDHGVPCGSSDAARKVMHSDEFTVSCVLGTGPGEAEILTCDLSPDYVSLNAGGST